MDNKVKFRIQFIKENNRVEYLNRVQVLDQFFNCGSDDLCKDCSEGDLCPQKLAKPSLSKSWKRQGNEIIGSHLNTHHGHKYQVECINIRRRSGSKNRQRNESTNQTASQTEVQASSLIANEVETASSQQPDETAPTEANLLLSDRLKSMNSHLSSELSHIENRQLNEQFKQQLSREISELKNKLDLVSDRYSLATVDFPTGAANPPYPVSSFGQPPTALPLNSFVLIPISLTQPPVGPALNQLNQTKQLRGSSHQLACCPGYSNSASFSSPYLCDDNFSRVRDLDDINQSRTLLNSIQAGFQQQLPISRSKP